MMYRGKAYYKSKKPKGYLWEFEMAQCDSCRLIGMLENTTRFIEEPRAYDLVFDKQPTTIYEHKGLWGVSPHTTFCMDCIVSIGIGGEEE